MNDLKVPRWQHNRMYLYHILFSKAILQRCSLLRCALHDGSKENRVNITVAPPGDFLAAHSVFLIIYFIFRHCVGLWFFPNPFRTVAIVSIQAVLHIIYQMTCLKSILFDSKANIKETISKI